MRHHHAFIIAAMFSVAPLATAEETAKPDPAAPAVADKAPAVPAPATAAPAPAQSIVISEADAKKAEALFDAGRKLFFQGKYKDSIGALSDAAIREQLQKFLKGFADFVRG